MALRVAFVELYRQWPAYFVDTFAAAQAGDALRAGHRVTLWRAALDDRPAPAESSAARLDALCAGLAAEAPVDLLVMDRVWSREVLAALVAAAGGPRVLINQWELPAAWSEVTWRASPLSRTATAGLIAALAEGNLPDAARTPNLWCRGADGSWLPPAVRQPLQVARELRGPLTLHLGEVTRLIGLTEPQARAARFLVLNMGCPYRGAANDTGFLDGLELAPAWGASGCTFCHVGPYEAQSGAERIDLMDRQLREIARSGPFDQLVVIDEYAFRDLDVLVERVIAHGIRDVELMVRARVDYLDSCAPQLSRALELLEGRGTLAPYLVGFENFSDAELQRFNKGQSGADVEAAVAKLDALAALHPNLRLSPSNGFILFTPWTTLADLRRNAEGMRRTDFRRLRGGVTRSRLRLDPDAALVARARADGLVLERHLSAEDDNAAAVGYQAETPWRFADPAAARVWELLNGGSGELGPGSELERLERAISLAGRAS